ncbi:MAG: hypothetical protein R2752_17260 [Vicinamibacterales bacterium]
MKAPIGLTMAALAAAGWATAARPSASQATEEKQVVVTVVAADSHAPVIGLPATAFALREDNLDREVVSAERATDPMAVVLLADTTTAFLQYAHELREAAQSFAATLHELSPETELAIWEFGGADIPVTDFTTDPNALREASLKLFPKGSFSNMSDADLGSLAPTGSRGQNVVASNLLEAVVGASRVLAKRPEHRRVIVSFNSDVSVEASALTGQRIQDEVQAARVTWFATSLSEKVANGPLRDNVMNVLCPVSGGLRTTIVDVAALGNAMAMAARTLASQYVLTYRRPVGTSPRNLLVGVRVEGLRVFAPRWPPQ